MSCADSNQLDFYLPNPSSDGLITLCDHVSERIAHPWTASDAAKYLSQSERTVSRKFQQELGLTFTEWLRQKRLIHALELVSPAATVCSTARWPLDTTAPSAFSAMFKSRIRAVSERIYGLNGALTIRVVLRAGWP